MRLMLILLCCSLAIPAFADDAPKVDASTLTVTVPTFITRPSHTLTLSDDGTVLLDERPVEQLQASEIKAILAEMVAELKRSYDQENMNDYLFRQTDYLLSELERCRKQ